MIESDEEFARRLQAEEDGLAGNYIQRPQTRENANPNPTVLNARLNDINSSRSTLCVLLTVSIPQIIASIVVLSMHWNDADVCDHMHTERWKWWSILTCLRIASYTSVVLYMHVYKAQLDRNPELNMRATNLRSTIDAFHLGWFVVGNMWLFRSDDGCDNPEKSPIYNLALSMLIINYIQICLPCILAILLVPVFCFCMPCLIRLLARLQDPRGASASIIDSLPEIVLSEADLQNPDGAESPESGTATASSLTCPICLSDMKVGETARRLRCNHLYHKSCVDEWLRENASCPTCRKRIVDSPEDSAESAHGPENSRNFSPLRTRGGDSMDSRDSQEIPLLRVSPPADAASNRHEPREGNTRRTGIPAHSRLLSLT